MATFDAGKSLFNAQTTIDIQTDLIRDQGKALSDLRAKLQKAEELADLNTKIRLSAQRNEAAAYTKMEALQQELDKEKQLLKIAEDSVLHYRAENTRLRLEKEYAESLPYRKPGFLERYTVRRVK